jgi:hypothetical protein
MKTHILCSTNSFRNSAAYEITWKNLVEASRPQMKVWHIRIACLIPKATSTHSEYVVAQLIFIVGVHSFACSKRTKLNTSKRN